MSEHAAARPEPDDLRNEFDRVSTELDRFFSLSSDMLAVFNLDGTFRRANPAWESILGYSGFDLVGRPFLDLVHPDDIARTLEEFKRASATGETVTQFENRYRHKDGSYRWLEWTGRRVPGEDVLYSAAREVTERHELENTRRATSELLSRMTSEFRTPVDTLLESARLLDTDGATPEQNETVARIIRACQQLRDLLDEVPDATRIEPAPNA